MPASTPVLGFMVPAAVLVLLHVPVAGLLLSVVVAPAHTAIVPLIGAGSGFTVITAYCCVSVGRVYVIVVVPASMPVTIPVDAFMVPTAVLPLVHVPPVGEQCSAVAEPLHTVIVPVITPGRQFTVTVAYALQPVGKV